MKKLLFLAICILCSFSVKAQDIIVKSDGTKVQAKVTEVSSSEVKYKKYANPEGPVYTVSTNDILMIDYENGESEVFAKQSSQSSTSAKLIPNEKYKNLKQQYYYKDYSSCVGDKYSPGWCGVGSAFIPGLGQAICNEWGRAAGFFCGNLALNIVGYNCLYYGNYEGSDSYSIIALACYSAALALDIYSIIDAVRVAKVKDLYFRDCQSASLNIRLEPQFAFVPNGIYGSQPTVGMALKVSF